MNAKLIMLVLWLLLLRLTVFGDTFDQPRVSANQAIQSLLAQFSEALFPPESTLTARNTQDDQRTAREALVQLEPLIEKDRVAGLKQLFLFRLTNPGKVAKPKSASGILLTYFAFTFPEIEEAKKAFTHMNDPETQRYFHSFRNLPPEHEYSVMCRERRETIRRDLGLNNK
ncbi:MAG: hypothetical protein KKB30_17225 [Proteobacteria bacterium]|nr:hypothetical protein [Pseudomonadota bacterium]MBU1691099.1 hypothetical protein [Gammaproteobacteria bacterium]